MRALSAPRDGLCTRDRPGLSTEAGRLAGGSRGPGGACGRSRAPPPPPPASGAFSAFPWGWGARLFSVGVFLYRGGERELHVNRCLSVALGGLVISTAQQLPSGSALGAGLDSRS